MHRTVAVTALSFCLTIPFVFAHHSVFAEFDRTQETQYRATVAALMWTNPHASFHARVTADDGPTTWTFELPAPYGLERVGWMRDTVKVNDSVVITAFPAKDGSARASVHRVVLSGGRTFEVDHPFAYQPDYKPAN
jgi:hypothetical protein